MALDWKSSYEANRLGEIFYALTRTHKPDLIVELGTKAGYSAFHMARALRENKRGSIHCYDLWEEYPFTSCSLSEARSNLEEYLDIVELHRQDAAKLAPESYASVDILHIDLGNDARCLEPLLTKWLPKVRDFVLLEGGSSERDAVDWMSRYQKQPMRPWLDAKAHEIEAFTLNPFPSLTLLRSRAGVR